MITMEELNLFIITTKIISQNPMKL